MGVNDIIYLLEHKIIEDDLIHTQDDKKYNSLNNQWGFRSIHLKLDNLIMNKSNSIEANYHYATFAHHNLKDKNTINHSILLIVVLGLFIIHLFIIKRVI